MNTPFHPSVVRASMGALFRQRFVRTDLVALRSWVLRHRVPVVGASPDGAVELHQYQEPGPSLLVMGEERGGLSVDQRALCSSLVRIPMPGSADSLNLAVAGSLLLYEVYRSQTVMRTS